MKASILSVSIKYDDALNCLSLFLCTAGTISIIHFSLAVLHEAQVSVSTFAFSN